MVDEQELREKLHRAAGAIVVPEGGPERIIAAALASVEGRAGTAGSTPASGGGPALPADTAPGSAGTGGPGPSAGRSILPRHARTRRLLVAAAVVLVGAAVTATALSGSGHRPLTSATSASPGVAPSIARTGASGSARTGSVSTGKAASPSTPDLPSGGTPSASAGAPSSGAASTGASSSGSATAPALPSGAVGQSAKVVANGSVDLTVGDGKLQAAVTTLTALATSAGGFVSSSQVQVGGPGPAPEPLTSTATPSSVSGSAGSGSSGTVVLRVPEPAFGSTVAQVQKVGHASSVTTSATDVTGQYVDLQARITALEQSRQQYLTIMSQATAIGDILAVQSQLDTVQSEIEQLQGQLDVLDNQTTYATLTVTLTEAGRRPPPPVHPQSGLTRALHDGVGGFVSGIEWLIRIAGTVLFVLLIAGALAFLGRWAWRANRRRML
jgi:hypothetical protein